MRSAFAHARKLTCLASTSTSPRLDIAGAYIDRIETACLALENFPERGTRRDDIRPGLRTMGFERRITIVFRVSRATVEIVRVFYGGQEYERALRGAPDA